MKKGKQILWKRFNFTWFRSKGSNLKGITICVFQKHFFLVSKISKNLKKHQDLQIVIVNSFFFAKIETPTLPAKVLKKEPGRSIHKFKFEPVWAHVTCLSPQSFDWILPSYYLDSIRNHRNHVFNLKQVQCCVSLYLDWMSSCYNIVCLCCHPTNILQIFVDLGCDIQINPCHRRYRA